MSESTPHDVETVGARLRRLRSERGLSQRELSGPGVSYAYISRIEAGERRPSVKALRVLAAKLGVSAEYLETGSDLTAAASRELKLADAELELRLSDQPASAIAKLEEVAQQADAAGDVPSATRARLALGLAAAQGSEHETAIARLEEALAQDAPPPHARPDVYATLGASYNAVERHADAIALFRRCLDEIAEHAAPDVGAFVRFSTYLSYALTDAGDIAGANDVVRKALERSQASVDPYTRVRLYWSLARITAVEGDAREALDYMRRAIALLEATDDTVHLGRAHAMAARFENTRGNAAGASEHLELAEALFGPAPEEVDLGMLRLEQARCAVLEDDGERAEPLAREALATFGPYHGRDHAESWLALADALALLGRDSDAETAYREAIPLLEAHAQEQVSKAQDGLERVLEGNGSDREAAEVYGHASGSDRPKRS